MLERLSHVSCKMPNRLRNETYAFLLLQNVLRTMLIRFKHFDNCKPFFFFSRRDTFAFADALIVCAYFGITLFCLHFTARTLFCDFDLSCKDAKRSARERKLVYCISLYFDATERDFIALLIVWIVWRCIIWEIMYPLTLFIVDKHMGQRLRGLDEMVLLQNNSSICSSTTHHKAKDRFFRF